MGDTKGFRLVTGEVVLASVVTENPTEFVIKDAAQMVTQEIEPGRMGVGLQPYVPYAKGSITLYKSSINASFDLDRQVENEYNRIFGSGIVIAGADSMPL